MSKTFLPAYSFVSPVFFLRDRDTDAEDPEQLERHFNDVCHLFLAKAARIPLQPPVSHAEEERLVFLLKQIFKLKRGMEKD